MTNRLTKALVITTMALSIGLQWTVLQAVAWVGMIVDYSAETSFRSAVAKTFDGKTQCDLCRFVAAGKKQERDNTRHFQIGRQDLLHDGDCAQVYAPTTLSFAILPDSRLAGRDPGPPPSPPPAA